jgi:hypothetical protein
MEKSQAEGNVSLLMEKMVSETMMNQLRGVKNNSANCFRLIIFQVRLMNI